MVALCDCNNFFASCERVFRPDLEGRPVVVLSGNDGCVVSRSNEAKALGIKMGVPFFQIEAMAKKHGVTAFSSNFSLYGDLSRRVMSILAKHTTYLEQYSVDEAFLDADHIGHQELKPYYEAVVRQVRQWVGIPISIGIAPSKTLAKIASHFAKRHAGYKGVCIIDSEEKRKKALELCAISDVWGIGRQAQKKLAMANIQTAWDLANQSAEFIDALLHKPGLQTWQELNGKSCIQTSHHAMSQSISQSRTFHREISDRAIIEKVLVDFTSYCAEKMRKQGSMCKQLVIYMHTSPFREEKVQAIHRVVTLPYATDITSELVKAMLEELDQHWKAYPYKKAGVILQHMQPAQAMQQDLFDERDCEKNERLQKAIDSINLHYGQTTVQIGTQVLKDSTPSISKKERLSPCYTTKLSEIMVIGK